ncbi:MULTISPECIES: transposase [Xanthomonas]|uniref:transposase n=1 Tax=Xanthomonas TaxID=338 RepID=UPI001EDD4C69|nr:MULTISPECIES: transposase [Xanthomonas]
MHARLTTRRRIAGLVAQQNLAQRGHSALTPHTYWLALGNGPIERFNAYCALVDERLSDELLASIRLHLQEQRALNQAAFCAMVLAKTRPFAGVMPAHWPSKPSTED